VASNLPKDVEQFLAQYIRSIEQLEVLLLLHRRPERDWSASAVSAELRIQEDSAGRRLGRLADQGFLRRAAESPPCYVFAADDRRAAQVAALGHAYKERRVAVITFIFSRPVDDVLVLADAFKLTKDPPAPLPTKSRKDPEDK
jgi:predicted ArsR family transcriptional regulator